MTFKRRFTRIPFAIGATLVCGERRLPAELLDISLKGALLDLSDPGAVGPGETVVLEVHLEDPQAVIVMPARVARLEGRQVGLAAGALDLDSMTRLRRLMELNLGDDDLVHRELAALWPEHPAA